MSEATPKYTVLIVEDHSTLIRGLKDNFINAGYTAITAMDGQSGLDAALENKPDLVILDIMLPKRNGYEVCQGIRQASLSMPIIMLTAKGQEDDIVRGLQVGADDYVIKPFSVKELLARSQAFLRRYANKSSSFTFGNFHYCSQSRKLYEADKEIQLTPKEQGLLELFIQRRGHALTRDTILNAVWHNNFMTTSRSVDRCINTLRKKIESNPRQPRFIISLRDIGYRFDAQDLSQQC